MPDITKFKCKTCDGTGGTGPLRVATGKPFHPCMHCDGTGKLERSVDDMWDRSGHMSAVAQLSHVRGTALKRRVDPAGLAQKKKAEAFRFRVDWDAATGGSKSSR